MQGPANQKKFTRDCSAHGVPIVIKHCIYTVLKVFGCNYTNLLLTRVPLAQIETLAAVEDLVTNISTIRRVLVIFHVWKMAYM